MKHNRKINPLAALVIILALASMACSLFGYEFEPADTAPVDTTGLTDGTGSDNNAVRQEFTAAQLDAEFGASNWRPFEDRQDGVAVHNIPRNYFISGDVICSVDKGIKYGSNETVQGTGGATAWLCGTLNETDWTQRLEDWNDGRYDGTTYSAPTTTGQVGYDYVCTVAAIMAMPNVTNVTVNDSANGQADVTVTGSTKIPAGWTVVSMGAKYYGDQGDYVPDEGTDSWWAPACGKPLK